MKFHDKLPANPRSELDREDQERREKFRGKKKRIKPSTVTDDYDDDLSDKKQIEPPAANNGVFRSSETTMETLHLFRQGRTVKEIAQSRQLVESTVYGHLARAIEAGEAVDLGGLVYLEDWRKITDAFDKFGHGLETLSLIVSHFGNYYSHGQLRMYRAVWLDRRGDGEAEEQERREKFRKKKRITDDDVRFKD